MINGMSIRLLEYRSKNRISRSKKREERTRARISMPSNQVPSKRQQLLPINSSGQQKSLQAARLGMLALLSLLASRPLSSASQLGAGKLFVCMLKLLAPQLTNQPTN